MDLLLITRCPDLHDAVIRLSAAAGVGPEVRGEPVVALTSWAAASVVLVGADVAGELAELAPARRAGVHVVGLGTLLVAAEELHQEFSSTP